MRVLYLVTKADLGGAQVHILDLLHGFRHALDPIVATGEKGYFTKEVQKRGIPCYVLPNLVHAMAPLKDCQALLDVAYLIRTVRADVVHAHTSKAGVIGRLAARAVGVPSVFTAHTWCFAEGTSWKWRIAGIPAERIAAWSGSVIINVSEANRKLALRHRISNPERMLTIWNGIPDTVHRARPDAPGVPTIVMVGRCVPQKDHSLLLQAIANEERPVRLRFIGDGPLLGALKAEADQLMLRDRVEFLGQRFDIAELLAGAQIFALATKWEGFPLSILEAMRAGLPVIASDVGGVSEAVIDGETGFLAGCGDLNHFRARISTLLDDPLLRRQLGEAGRRRYETKFTLDRMLGDTLDAYQMAAVGARVPESRALPRAPYARTGLGYGPVPRR